VPAAGCSVFCEKIVKGNLRCAKGGPREAVTLGAGRVALCEAHAQAEYRRRGRCPWPRSAAERAPTGYEEKWIQPSTTDRPQQGRHSHGNVTHEHQSYGEHEHVGPRVLTKAQPSESAMERPRHDPKMEIPDTTTASAR
jgi:hypothetical protein